MFTGIIENKANVTSIEKDQSGVKIKIRAEFSGQKPETGDSIAINGVCLTVDYVNENEYGFYISFKTLELTNLGALHKDSTVNTERAMKADSRFGGHMVSGHVDCTGEIISIQEIEKDVFQYVLKIPQNYTKYIMERGSIAIDGISLTIVAVKGNELELVLIPETMQKTTAGDWRPGYKANIEFDMLMRYMESLLKNSGVLPKA